MRPDDLALSLSTVAGGVVPTEAATSDDLKLVRHLLARTVAAGHAVLGEGEIAPTPADPADLDPAVREELSTAVERAAEASDPLLDSVELPAKTRVYRRGTPVGVAGAGGSVPASAVGQRVTRTFGPFLDRDGRPVWFNAVIPVEHVALVRSPSTTPLLTLPLDGFNLGPAQRYDVPAGSVWIAVAALGVAAPAGGYCGLRVTGGTLSLSAAPAVTGQTLVIGPGVRAVLELSVEPGAPPAAGGPPGAEAAAARVDVPATVEFGFDPVGGSLRRADDAVVSAYRSGFTLTWADGPAGYDPDLGRLTLPFTPDTDAFAVRHVESPLFEPDGETRVTAAAWTLPVAVAAPADLGEAAGAGGLALYLSEGLGGRWRGLAGPPGRAGRPELRLDPAVVLVEPGRLEVLAARARGPGHVQVFRLWPPDELAGSAADRAPSQARLACDPVAPLRYIAVAGELDVVSAGCAVEVSVDRPRPASGGRFPLRGPGAVLLWTDPAGDHVILTVQPGGSVAGPARTAVALRNMLATVAPPDLAFLAGTLASPSDVDGGRLSVLMSVVFLTLTLPDPYASNQVIARERGVAAAAGSAAAAGPRLLGSVRWTAADRPQVSFTLLTPAGQRSPVAAATAGRPAAVTQPEAPVRAAFAAVGDEPPDPRRSAEEDAAAGGRLRAIFERTAGSTREALFVLDVSTNIDQFGVGFGISRRDESAPAAVPQFAIDGLDLVAPARNVRLFLLPQFQWEPVVNVPNPELGPYPDRLVSGDDGGPTLLGSNSVRLVPVRPDTVCDNLLTEFADENTAVPVGTLFTLPFGIRAAAMLFPRSPGALNWAAIADTRSDAKSGDLTGGRQLAVSAHRADTGPGVESPSLPGAAWQTRNGVDPLTLAPNGFSVLRGDVSNAGVEAFFNAEMGPGGTRPRVPVVRIDLAGYGASLFSRWANPNAVAEVGQTRFDAFVGRTAYEVIQVASVLYPWAAPVVRTITLERRKEGAVLRSDSGWVATAPGLYRYPAPDPAVPLPPTWSPLQTHPGVVRGAYDIRRIRETGRVVRLTADGELVELLEVRFDADFDIEDAVAGQNPGTGRVPGLDHVGFVQRSPKGYPLSPSQLAAVLAAEGAVGGPAPCVVDVAASGQRIRVARVEVDATVAVPPGTPEFAAAARGALNVPQDGQWTVVRRAAGAGEPEPVDQIAGVPLVRAGRITGPASPWYRFADAADVLRENDPRREYTLVQSSDGHQIQFPRPRIAAGTTTISSTERPLLADAYARATAAGLFAAAAVCFPGLAPWELRVDGSGRYTFGTGAPADFQNIPGAQRTLVDNAGLAIRTSYSGPIRFSLNPAADPVWAVQIDNLLTSMDLGPFEALMGVQHNYRVDANRPGRLEQPEQLYAPFLAPVVAILRFLTDLLGIDSTFGVVPVPGSFKFQAKLRLPLLAPPDDYLDFGGFKLKGELSAAFGWSDTNKWFGSVLVEFGMKVPALPPIFANGKAAVSLKGSELTSQEVTIRVMWGWPAEASLGPLEVTAEFNYGIQVVVATTGAWQIGLLVEVVGKAKVLIFVVAVKLELMAAIGRKPPPSHKVEAIGRAKFAAEVTICWFLTISIEYTIEYREELSI